MNRGAWQAVFHGVARSQVRLTQDFGMGICLLLNVFLRGNKGLLLSYTVVSYSLRPYRLQHARLPCPSLFPRVFSDSCLLSQWCHPTISSSVAPFSSCLQFFPASGSFPMSWLFTSSGQSIGASESVLPMNIQGWFLLNWLAWYPCCPRDSQESSPASQFQGIKNSVLSLFYCSGLTSVHDYWKNHIFDYMDLFWQSDVSAF